MTHEGSPSLISLDLSYHPEREESSLRRWLASSLVFHIVVALVALNLRFSPTIEHPLSSYEVSLVSLPELKAPAAPSRSKAKRVKQKRRRVQPARKPKEEILPPLPTTMATERLSESFAGAVQSIVVPGKLTSQPKPEPVSKVKTSTDPSKALENIKLPSRAPSLTPAEPLTPRERLKVPNRVPKPNAKATPAPTTKPIPKKSPPTRVNVEETLQGIKAPPKAPALTPLQPFTKSQEVETSPSLPEPLTPSLKEKIQSVPIPKPIRKIHKAKQVPRTKQDSPQPAKKRERLADSLKQVLESVNVPQLRHIPETPQSRPETSSTRDQASRALKSIQLPKMSINVPKDTHPPVKPDPDFPVSKKFRTEIDQQLAKLNVPDVAPIESIRTRLQLQDARSGDSESALSPSTSSKSSRNTEGQNRYLGLVQAKIDQEWIAPPVSAHETHLQVVLKFRILKSGEVTNLEIERESGNSYYDAAAKRAVQAAEPLPPFPPEMRESHFDVRYNFTLGESPS